MKPSDERKQHTGHAIRVLGLTGGVGSGKSTILNHMRIKFGAAIIVCDDVARQLQQPGRACYEPMIELLGRGVVREDGTFDRQKIAHMVFVDEQMRLGLNAIVHPAVKTEVMDQIEAAACAQAPFAVIEAALLLDDGYDQICDEVWYVYADREVRIRRLMSSRGYSREKCLAIMASQKSEEFFRSHCAVTIDNSADDVNNTFDILDRQLAARGYI